MHICLPCEGFAYDNLYIPIGSTPTLNMSLDTVAGRHLTNPNLC